MRQPELGWTTPVEVIKVLDGDTVRVRFSREVDIRLTDKEGTFDTPETWRPKDEAERLRGVEYTAELAGMLWEADEIVLHIPTDDRTRVKDIFSIGSRAVGMIFADGVDVVEEIKKLDSYEKQ